MGWDIDVDVNFGVTNPGPRLPVGVKSSVRREFILVTGEATLSVAGSKKG